MYRLTVSRVVPLPAVVIDEWFAGDSPRPIRTAAERVSMTLWCADRATADVLYDRLCHLHEVQAGRRRARLVENPE